MLIRHHQRIISGVTTNMKISRINHPRLRDNNPHRRRLGRILNDKRTTRTSSKSISNQHRLMRRTRHRQRSNQTKGTTRLINSRQLANTRVSTRTRRNISRTSAINPYLLTNLNSDRGVNRVKTRFGGRQLNNSHFRHPNSFNNHLKKNTRTRTTTISVKTASISLRPACLKLTIRRIANFNVFFRQGATSINRCQLVRTNNRLKWFFTSSLIRAKILRTRNISRTNNALHSTKDKIAGSKLTNHPLGKGHPRLISIV